MTTGTPSESGLAGVLRRVLDWADRNQTAATAVTVGMLVFLVGAGLLVGELVGVLAAVLAWMLAGDGGSAAP